MFVHLPSNQEQFISLLSKQERKILVHAFAYLARLDRQLLQVEIDPIHILCRELGFDPQIILGSVATLDLEDILEPLQEEKSKRIILQELINLAYADGEYSPEERAGIQKIAETMGLDPAVSNGIEEWVEKGRAWVQEGTKLMLAQNA